MRISQEVISLNGSTWVLLSLTPRHIETKHPPPTPPGSSPKRHLYGDGSNRYKKPRTSNACRGCADSKVKCDGVTPVCGRCLRRERECIWTRPKDSSPKFRSIERLSDGSNTPTIPPRRASDQSMIMDSAPPNACPEVPLTDSPVIPVASTSLPSRPSLTPVLSFASNNSAASVHNLTHRHSMPAFPAANSSNFSSSFAPSATSMQAQASLPHASQSTPITMSASQQSTQTNEYGSYPSQPNHSENVYTAPTPHFSISQLGYGSDFYTAGPVSIDSSLLSWNVDNQFDIPGQGLTANPFTTTYDPMTNWSEKFENMLAEGLDVSMNERMDRESASTPSVKEDEEMATTPQPHPDRPRPTSHPTSSAPAGNTPRLGDAERRGRSQPEFMGYEFGDQRDMRSAVQNMEIGEPTNILLQENARKLRNTGVSQPSRFSIMLSNVRLSEEKRDDIKSMLDDTFAHSRLMYPSEQEHPRLPRLEIFNILLKSYFHNFHPQHPLLHLPSLFRKDGASTGLEKKKDVLIYAMCCAGAFRHAARPIQEYARGMQELLRRTFNYHFEKDPHNFRDLQSMQAWHLSLFIGGWSGSARATEEAQGACGRFDAMLRCGNYLDGQRGDWFEDEHLPVGPGEEEERWAKFVECEERKRLVIYQLWFECHLGSFMRVKPAVSVSELTMPMLCETDLWCAETAEDWAKLWNQKLRTRLPHADRHISDFSVSCFLRRFVKLSEDFNTVEECAQHPEYRRHLPIFLLGIHSYVTTFADLRSSSHWDSKATNATIAEARRLLDYWWLVLEASESHTEWMEHRHFDIGRGQEPEARALLDTCKLLYHFTALMVHVPLREIRLMNERNHRPSREAATNRLWRTWRDRTGEDARLGLWHAGQIIRLARSMIANETGPLWLGPMVAEAANVMWSYGALILYDNQSQRGGAFNGEHFLLDYECKWADIPFSTRNMGVPSIAGRKGEILTLFDPPAVVTECAEMLNRGSIGANGKKSKQSIRGRTILDEQFVTQLEKLVKFGKVDFLVAGLREGGTSK